MQILTILLTLLLALPIWDPAGEADTYADAVAPVSPELTIDRETWCGGKVTPKEVRRAYQSQASYHMDLAVAMADGVDEPTYYMTVVRVGEMAYGPRMETPDTPFYPDGLLDQAEKWAEETRQRLSDLVAMELVLAQVALEASLEWKAPTEAQRALPSDKLAEICRLALWESRGPEKFAREIAEFKRYLEEHDIRPVEPKWSIR